MAAIDLSGTTNSPYIHRASSVGTTWQEIKIPSWCTRVSLAPDAAIYWAVIGAETPTDGGAVGSHYMKLAADSMLGITWRDPDDEPTEPSVTRASSIFVAAQTGTANLSIGLEMGRD